MAGVDPFLDFGEQEIAIGNGLDMMAGDELVTGDELASGAEAIAVGNDAIAVGAPEGAAPAAAAAGAEVTNGKANGAPKRPRRKKNRNEVNP